MKNAFVVWLRGVAENAAVAFGTVLLVLWPTELADVNISWGHKLYVAGGAAILAVLKGALASLVGNRSSTSFQGDLPKDQVLADPPNANVQQPATPDGQRAVVLPLGH